MKVLQMADSNQPVIGKVYHACFEVLQHLKKLDLPPDVLEAVVHAFEERWEQLTSDLHRAAYALDPEFQKHDFSFNPEVGSLSAYTDFARGTG